MDAGNPSQVGAGGVRAGGGVYGVGKTVVDGRVVGVNEDLVARAWTAGVEQVPGLAGASGLVRAEADQIIRDAVDRHVANPAVHARLLMGTDVGALRSLVASYGARPRSVFSGWRKT